MAAALPVLVHLVRRTRAVKLEFPSLMFLRRIEQKTIRKRRLRNLALLALALRRAASARARFCAALFHEREFQFIRRQSIEQRHTR